MNSTFVIAPQGYLNKKVQLLEGIDGIKEGSIGLCTADLNDIENNVFAVIFTDYGWVAFHPNNTRDKFKIFKEGL
jgi:hypothetical protein